MSADTSKLRKKIAKLNKSLDELESQLEPLFAQSLDETLLGLDTIQQAKMQVIIPYVVYDLVFGGLYSFSLPLRDTDASASWIYAVVYLKTRGVDPMTHPVIAELVRLPWEKKWVAVSHNSSRICFSHRTAYGNTLIRSKKPKNRTRNVSQERSVITPTTRTRTGKLGIDKQAAGRFIKHAIAQAKNVQLVNETEEDAESSTAGPSTAIPVKVTAKMLERAEYEKKLKETADEEEEDLEVFGENVEEDYPMDDVDELPADVPSDVRSADKGKEPEEPGRVDEEQVGSRRKRPRIDPFAGMYLRPVLLSLIHASLQATTPRSLPLLVPSRNLS